MLLDHSTLEPFEPIVDKLFDSAFGGLIVGRLTSAGISTEDVWYTPAFFLFRAACLTAFKKTHSPVGNMLLDLLSDRLPLWRRRKRLLAQSEIPRPKQSSHCV